MKPEKLVMTNIGPFKGRHVLDFTALGNMFLVYGKTGAGKTTLFDAIAYAFYGDAPGGRKGLVRQMRSQYAPENEDSSVELTFLIGGKRYRIGRTLPVERVGARSGKLKLVAEESSLEVYAGSEWKNESSTNKSETDAKILSLIGLSEEEFSRIVLLPQGEFARFLRQNSTERKQVLSKLFPVSVYTRVIDKAREQAKNADLRLKNAETAILALQGRFNHLSYAEDREILSQEILSLKRRHEEKRKTLSEKTAHREKARAAGLKRQELIRLTEELSQLEMESEAMERLKTQLSGARKAAPLIARIQGLEAKKETLAKKNQEAVNAEKEAALLAGQKASLDARYPRIRELTAQKEALLVKHEGLRMAVHIAGDLETLGVEIAENAAATATKKKELADLRSFTAETDGRLSALSLLYGELESLTERSLSEREKLEREKQVKLLADDYFREETALRAHLLSVEESDTRIAQAEKDRTICAALCRELEDEAEREAEDNSAGVLAKKLEEGKPCPVCGSTSHPRPAQGGLSASFGAKERLESERRKKELLEKEYAQALAEKTSRSQLVLHAQDRISALMDRIGLSREDMPKSAEEAAARLKEAVQAMQAAQDALSSAQRAQREAEDLRKKTAQSAESEKALNAALAELAARKAGLKAAIDEKEKRYREALPQGETPDPSEATDARDECQANILVIEAEIAAWNDDYAAVSQKLSGLQGKKETLETECERLYAETTREEAELGEDIKRGGWTDSAKVLEAGLSAKEIEEGESAHSRWTHEIAEKSALQKKLNAEAGLWTGPAEDALAMEIEELENDLSLALSSIEEASSRLSGLDELERQRAALEAERATAATEAGRYKALSNDLTGANPLNISFDAWILGMYLEEITSYANVRLETMSEGRYRIRLNDSYRKGNSLSGLDLEILDSFTGKARPSGTLSGGETFMTSISLALGLADSIQARSGGIQLDAVFIDEGFGSLDEHSLEKAIGILDDVRGSRMVGIISHVSELRTRLPSRVEIVKTGAGSKIRMEEYT